LPERQQTLRNTLHWSYDLLSPQEQWLFRLFAVFVGGCTLEAVEAVAAAVTGTRASLLDAVAALVDKSLLVPLAPEEEEPRFRMLETVREYGLECLRTRGESEASREAHADYYLALAEQADAHLKGRGQQAQWLRWLIQEQANLRAALSWFVERQDAQSLLRLSGVVWWFWTIRGASSEALEWLQTALRFPGAEAPTAARARALCGAGYVTSYLHNRRRESIAMLSESLALYRQLGELHGLAETFGWFAQVQMYLKDYSAARALAEEGIALSEALGERRFVAFNHSMLALVIEKQGDEAEAVAQWKRSLALGRELDEHTGLVARALRHLASLAYARGDFAYSRALLEENLAIAREAGNASAICWSLARLAQIDLMEGDDTRASALCAEGVALARQVGDPYTTSRLLSVEGKIAQARREQERALAAYRESLALAATINADEITGYCLLGLAQEALAAEHSLSATRLLAAATRHLSITRQLAPIERAVYERKLADLRTRLDASTFSALWAQGEVMTPKEALSVDILHQEQESLPRAPSDSKEPAHSRKQADTPPYADGLTAREVEVLRLVAQGYTDAQIAEELVISTRTVNAHLTSLYRKIRVSSRHAAAQYARTRHLL
jgi:DNA-binding CsgD family transcriptional regulator/tetratricopeptide (TPR) repeat protein